MDTKQIAEMVKRLELKRYAPHGMAAMLPGIQMMAEVLPVLIREFAEEWETQVKAAFGIANMDTMLNEFAELEPLKVKHKRRGRPRKDALAAAAAPEPEPPKLINGWPADPEERKKEMARRMAMRGPQAEKARRLKIGKATKARWGNMSVRQRKEYVNRTVAGRSPKTPVVHLEQAS